MECSPNSGYAQAQYGSSIKHISCTCAQHFPPALLTLSALETVTFEFDTLLQGNGRQNPIMHVTKLCTNSHSLVELSISNFDPDGSKVE